MQAQQLAVNDTNFIQNHYVTQHFQVQVQEEARETQLRKVQKLDNPFDGTKETTAWVQQLGRETIKQTYMRSMLSNKVGNRLLPQSSYFKDHNCSRMSQSTNNSKALIGNTNDPAILAKLKAKEEEKMKQHRME